MQKRFKFFLCPIYVVGMEIGIVGAPNSGKSTFFNAATMLNAQVGPRPFVTIKPNQGVGFLRVECPHTELGKSCNPKHGYCVNGVRFVPVKLVDVAGLVPDAWQGKGLGNQFLNDLMQASVLIHVLDASGSTDAEGNMLQPGSYDPMHTVEFLKREINQWIAQILKRNWPNLCKKAASLKKPVQVLAEQLSGLGITEEQIKSTLAELDASPQLSEWSDGLLFEFCEHVRKQSKPMLIAANKADIKEARQNITRLKNAGLDEPIIPTSAEAELALRRAAKEGMIKYLPGDSGFELLKEPSEKQRAALNFIKEHVLKEYGSTGVQLALNVAAFELLGMIVVFPVEDQHKWSDSQGNVLPDAILLPKGAKAVDLAGSVHSSFVERFVAAIDCRSNQRIGKEDELKNGAVIKIQLRS
jgi:hypothetical protein